MASETIVAVYDTPAHAELAVADLRAAGVPEHAIQHYTGEQYGYGSYDAAHDGPAAGVGSSHVGSETIGSQTYDPARDPTAHPSGTAHTAGTTHTGERQEGLWSWLFGDERERSHESAFTHESAYNQSLRSGGTVVTVTVEQTDAERVITILEEHRPTDIEEHAAQTTSGTAGYGAVSAATTAQSQTYGSSVTGTTGGNTEEVIALSEESLQVGKREVDRGTTRVRRYVVERPVEEQVRLRDEKVSVFRRPVTNATVGADAFSDKTIDVRETAEEAVVGKSARVVEEVVVRKGVEERSETVRDTLRKEEVEITGPGGAAASETLRSRTA